MPELNLCVLSPLEQHRKEVFISQCSGGCEGTAAQTTNCVLCDFGVTFAASLHDLICCMTLSNICKALFLHDVNECGIFGCFSEIYLKLSCLILLHLKHFISENRMKLWVALKFFAIL